MIIRPETAADESAIHALNVAAFPSDAEARLVDCLRASADPVISLVAESDGDVVGHILFSPVTHAERASIRSMGLAPMAVLPERQRQGIGSQLVDAGLRACREAGVEALVVLGHPQYYPRFGFVPASEFSIDSEYDVPDDTFMALELVPGALAGTPGTVRYHRAFAEL